MRNHIGNSHAKLDMAKVNDHPAPSDALVVFGATGDLAHKMIFPALYAMVKNGELAADQQHRAVGHRHGPARAQTPTVAPSLRVR